MTDRLALIIALSLSAAFAFASSASLKHISAGHVPDARNLQPSRLGGFIRATLSHPLWLGGIACDAVGLTLQLLALHLGALAVVQPLLISGLLFALILGHRRGNPISRRQAGWAATLTAALAAFVLLATGGAATAAQQPADRVPAVVAGAVGAVLALVCIDLGRRRRRHARAAALLGIAVGVIYAATAALLKAVTNILARAPLHVLYSWQLYAAAVLGAAGLLLTQLGFQAGPLRASLPATATVDPLLSIVVGVAVYDEHIRRGPAGGTLLIGLLLVLGVAVIQLARDTTVSTCEPHDLHTMMEG